MCLRQLLRSQFAVEDFKNMRSRAKQHLGGGELSQGRLCSTCRCSVVVLCHLRLHVGEQLATMTQQ